MAKDISLVIGIDEAGRGPVLGDMVIAVAVFREDVLEAINGLGVRDSKLLTPNIREKLVPYIIKYSLAVIVSRISPIEIDHYNLNELTISRIDYILGSLSKVIDPFQVRRITIDMITGYRKYSPNYKRYFPDADVIFEVDADAKYAEVSAASIIAKYYRDQLINELKRYYGEIGSGYPTDQRTINWIKSLYKKGYPPPPFIRRTWGVLEKIAPKWHMGKKKKMRRRKKQKTLTDFMD
ncbi:MAG: ribonuclease HII [Thermoprotei archaeon]|nr:MAG: ribonuclease HII [Thermoprotei archaeon]